VGVESAERGNFQVTVNVVAELHATTDAGLTDSTDGVTVTGPSNLTLLPATNDTRQDTYAHKCD